MHQSPLEIVVGRALWHPARRTLAKRRPTTVRDCPVACLLPSLLTTLLMGPRISSTFPIWVLFSRNMGALK